MVRIVFDRNGETGNIFYIIGMALAALKRNGNEEDAMRLWERVESSTSYDEALSIIGEYVELAEVQDEKADNSEL